MPNATFGFEDETRGWPGHALGSGQGMADAAFQLCQAWSCPCPRHKWADVCKTDLLPAKLSRLDNKWLVLLGLVLKGKLIFPIFCFEFGLCSLPFSILWPLSECLSESLILNFDHVPTFSINVCPPQKRWFGLCSKYINEISIKNIIPYFQKTYYVLPPEMLMWAIAQRSRQWNLKYK